MAPIAQGAAQGRRRVRMGGSLLYVVGKLLLLLESPQAVLAFLDRHCDVSKFERLVLRS